MKHFLTLALLFLATSAHAQTINATVKKVDEEAGKITLDHAPIPNLNMESMTMVFRVATPEMLKGYKAGDKIKFDAERVNGAITLTKMKKQ
jgi:Cu(I)/Ag(I) efflux system periplasmic protein CusF